MMNFKFSKIVAVYALLATFATASSASALELTVSGAKSMPTFNLEIMQSDQKVNEVQDRIEDLTDLIDKIKKEQAEHIACANSVDPNTGTKVGLIWDGQNCVAATPECVKRPKISDFEKKVTFVFDASGSMNDPLNSGFVNTCVNDPVAACGFYPSSPVGHICGNYPACWSSGSKKVWNPKTEKYDTVGTSKCPSNMAAKQAKWRTCYNKVKNSPAQKEAERKAKLYEDCVNKHRAEYATCTAEFEAEKAKAETRLTRAKAAVRNSINAAPANVTFGLVVYNGCSSITNHGNFELNRRNNLKGIVGGIVAAGETPISASMNIASSTMGLNQTNGRGIMVLVSDGEETCGGNTCAMARTISRNYPKLQVNVIDLSSNQSLSCISSHTNGDYVKLLEDGRSLEEVIEDSTGKKDFPDYCYAGFLEDMQNK